MTSFLAACVTDVGHARASNQDAVYANDRLLIVADGMGGHAGGEVAAQSAVSGIVHAFSTNPSAKGLVAGTRTVNREIFDRAEHDHELRGMGTTLVAMAVVPQRGGDAIELINVGDSRAYLLESGMLEQLTEDHSLVEEMRRQGELTQSEADVHPFRHVLTRAVGINDRVDVDSWTITPVAGTRFLLCSDGLTNECSDEDIRETLVAHADPQDAAFALVRRALEHGGADNITVIVADVAGVRTPAPARPARRAARSPRARRFGAVATEQEPPPTAAPPTLRRLGEEIVTFRTALFSFVLVLVLAGALGFTVWFDKASYFIGIQQDHVAIFNGRPGGFLWFEPTVVAETPLTVDKVLPANLPLLRTGMLEPSYAVAKEIVANLTNERSAIAAITAGTANGTGTTSGAGSANG